MARRVLVALKVAHNNGIFSYLLPEEMGDELTFGRRVKVEFRKRLLTGIIIGDDPSHSEDFKIKAISSFIDNQAVITKEQLDLMDFAARYYLGDLGAYVHLAVPRNEKAVRTKKTKPVPQEKDLPALSPAQAHAAEQILENLEHAYLLEGITGSGKTHVYIEVAHKMLQEKKSILFIVPEISLTPQLIERVEKALAIKAVVMHSNISPAQKRDNIFRLLQEEAQVLIGARSAIFAPLKNLGLIVVDEEHDGSLKQDESPRYHARDLALWRAKKEKACVILGSATPSLETILNAERLKLKHLKLDRRFHEHSTLPTIEIIDLKERAEDVDFRTQDQSKSSGQKMCILSRPLVRAMKKTIDEGLQVLLFLNQRGYARFGVCYQCGTMVECPHCSVGMTYYQQRQTLMCHQCNYVERAYTTCRNCLNESIRFVGLGTERLHEEVRILFPDAVVERLDRDIVQSQKRLENTLKAMHNREAHILIGTQMVAKGHDFLHVGLVGVVCADIGLSSPDFRAGEKTFQLLVQVAGRAGRGNRPGLALIQTFNPLHPSIHFAKTYDSDSFVKAELSLRKRFLQPPYRRAALIRTEHLSAKIAEDAINEISQLLPRSAELQILGPTSSPIERINNRYRFQLLAMASSSALLHQQLLTIKNNRELINYFNKLKVRLAIDIDPYLMT